MGAGGTTSACAENTPLVRGLFQLFWNYLRVRGEYQPQRQPDQYRKELPPRARRIRHILTFRLGHGGTTSACAENTLTQPARCGNTWNYLRVRGEYADPTREVREYLELPPRARRILCHAEGVMAAGGTTSACAENTDAIKGFMLTCGNYLRVRGEY